MTGTGAPRSREQEQPADVADALPAGAPDDGGQPQQSPAMVRAAKLNAANMIRSLLPLLLICLAFAGWAALRQAPDDPVIEVDPSSSVRITAERAGYQLLVPTGLPDGYRPTSARTTAAGATEGQPVTLEIGYLTPGEEFAGFVISDDGQAAPLRRVLDGAEEQGAASIGGRNWTRQSTAEGETAFVLEAGDATVLVFGSATDDELTEVAGSVAPYRG
jgi:hypothetical protein